MLEILSENKKNYFIKKFLEYKRKKNKDESK